MVSLRVILIVFAVLLLAGIYWWGRRESRGRAASLELPPAPARPEPARIDSEPITAHPIIETALAGDELGVLESPRREVNFDAPAVTAEDPPDAPSEETTAAEPDAAEASFMPKIIALRLVAAVPRFSGAHLRTALEAEALSFGKYQIFHRTTPEGDIVFSIASMVEPGSFDLEHMFDEQFPGLVLFAQLPGALDGVSVVNDLISCGRRLQQTLGGVLQDEEGAPLLAPRIEQLRRAVRDIPAAGSIRVRSES